MRIGVDFDNTLVSYNQLFHTIALEAGQVPPALPVSKLAVRDHLRQTGREAVWTEMQGFAYGARMDEARAYPGAIDFLRWARDASVAVFIISHKTKHPFIGPSYDLHEAARRWIDTVLRDEHGALVQEYRVHFEPTKPAKMARIGESGCACFVDDLPEILLAPDFPRSAEPILFDPEGVHGTVASLLALRSWAQVRAHVEARWSSRR